MSKGHKRRPTQVSREEADKNWDKVFGKKKCAVVTVEKCLVSQPLKHSK